MVATRDTHFYVKQIRLKNVIAYMPEYAKRTITNLQQKIITVLISVNKCTFLHKHKILPSKFCFTML